MLIHRLLYRSDVALDGSASDIRQQVAGIVERSAARNADLDLTGALLHTRGVFIQALEGPLPVLEATFERICCDLRHRQVALLEFLPADERLFGAWSMVRVKSDGLLEQLFTSGDLIGAPSLDAVSAQAAIRLMRSLLIADAAPTHEPAVTPIAMVAFNECSGGSVAGL